MLTSQRWKLVLLGLAIFLLGLPNIGQAQFPRYESGYQSPYGPPVSPNVGSLRYGGSFYSGSAVRRDQSVRRSIERSRWQLNQQSAQIRSLQQRYEQNVAPTGTGGHFFDYSHYYSFPGRQR